MQELGEFADDAAVPGAVWETSARPEVGCSASRGPGFTAWQEAQHRAGQHPAAQLPAPGRHLSAQSHDRPGPTSGLVPLLLHTPATPAPNLALFQPAPSRLPRVITTVLVLLVTAVVLTATVTTHRNDARQRLAAPVVRAAAASAPAPAPAGDGSIAISTASGAGLLVVLSHSWTSTANASSAFRQLRIEVQLTCSSGEIGYDPYAFQAFDARGQLFEVVDARGVNSLEAGTLSPSERVRGALVFELPRGDVTLLMTDELAESVTALRILD